MKKFILIAFGILMVSITPVLAQEKTDDVTVKVSGLVCDFCAQSLKKVFGKEDSVNDIAVDLDTQTVTIDTKDGMSIDDAKIKELIEWGGYDLISIERN